MGSKHSYISSKKTIIPLYSKDELGWNVGLNIKLLVYKYEVMYDDKHTTIDYVETTNGKNFTIRGIPNRVLNRADLCYICKCDKSLNSYLNNLRDDIDQIYLLVLCMRRNKYSKDIRFELLTKLLPLPHHHLCKESQCGKGLKWKAIGNKSALDGKIVNYISMPTTNLIYGSTSGVKI